MSDRGDILRGTGDTEGDRELRARTQARFSTGPGLAVNEKDLVPLVRR